MIEKLATGVSSGRSNSADGRLDVLVTHAANVFEGSIEATPEATFRELLEVDLTAPFRMTRACFQNMRARGRGSMIQSAPMRASARLTKRPPTPSSSAGLIALAELFAAEGVLYGVRSNAVCPEAMPPSAGTGADVASVVAWLASDRVRTRQRRDDQS